MVTLDFDNRTQSVLNYSFIGFLLIGLFVTSRYNYLLFHNLAEFFSIAVAYSFFMIAWHSRFYIKNQYILFIGIAYFFIGTIDMFHTLSYKGMPIFTDYAYYANQLWIGARYMESLTLLIGFFLLASARQLWPGAVFLIYTFMTALLLLSIFVWHIFPVCFIDGLGQTQFKIYSEYLICLILSLDILLLQKNRHHFEDKIYRMLLWSIIFTIFSELSFTFYVSNYGLSNLIGHYFKIFSFFLIYRAIIVTGIEKPYELIFLDLDRANRLLNEEITIRKNTETEKGKLIENLQSALEKIKKLEGIIPICMHCKKIRDDKGYWSQLEQFLDEHSEAKLSHGICPQCLDTHYRHIRPKKSGK